MPRHTILLALLGLTVGGLGCDDNTVPPKKDGGAIDAHVAVDARITVDTTPGRDQRASDGSGAKDLGVTDGRPADGKPDAPKLPTNRAFFGAPPALPATHPGLPCNADCLLCHKTGSGGARKTPHPERLICLQCHLVQENVGLWVPNTFQP